MICGKKKKKDNLKSTWNERTSSSFSSLFKDFSAQNIQGIGQ